MSLVPSGQARQSPRGCYGPGRLGRLGARERIRPFPQHRTRSASFQNLPQGEQGSCAGSTPARLAPLLLSPGKSSCSPPVSVLPKSGLSIEPPCPLAVWWQCRDPAAKLGCAGSHHGSDRLLSLRITQRSSRLLFFLFPAHPWSIPPSSAAAALATTAPASPPAAAPPKSPPKSKHQRRQGCPQHCSGELALGLIHPPRKGVSPRWVQGARGAAAPASAPALCRLRGNGSFLELTGKLGRGGKEPSGATSPWRHRRGQSPHAGAAAGDADVAPAPR